MSFERPAFMGTGLFKWNGLGYQFKEPPPIDLLSPAALENPNPWVLLAAVLQRAKTGDFDAVHRLINCLRDSEDGVLSDACALVIGDAGPSNCLKRMLKELGEDWDQFVSLALSCSSLLWTVPTMLDIYSRMPNRKEAPVVRVFLSKIFDFGWGPLGHGHVSEEEHRKLVMERYNALREQFGSDDVPVLYGKPISIREVIVRLKDELESEELRSMIIRELRHRFEASTGIDCSSFYQDQRLQPLAASAIVEEFLETGKAGKYEEGARYFFGHRIPD